MTDRSLPSSTSSQPNKADHANAQHGNHSGLGEECDVEGRHRTKVRTGSRVRAKHSVEVIRQRRLHGGDRTRQLRRQGVGHTGPCVGGSRSLSRDTECTRPLNQRRVGSTRVGANRGTRRPETGLTLNLRLTSISRTGVGPGTRTNHDDLIPRRTLGQLGRAVLEEVEVGEATLTIDESTASVGATEDTERTSVSLGTGGLLDGTESGETSARFRRATRGPDRSKLTERK